MKKMLEEGTNTPMTGQFNGMKCAPGKCG